MNADGIGSPPVYCMVRMRSPHSEAGSGLTVDVITKSPPKTVISDDAITSIVDAQSTTERLKGSVLAKTGSVFGHDLISIKYSPTNYTSLVSSLTIPSVKVINAGSQSIFVSPRAVKHSSLWNISSPSHSGSTVYVGAVNSCVTDKMKILSSIVSVVRKFIAQQSAVHAPSVRNLSNP